MEPPPLGCSKLREKVLQNFKKSYSAVYTLIEFLDYIIQLKDFSQKKHENFLTKTIITTNSNIDYSTRKFELKDRSNMEIVLKRTIERMMSAGSKNVLVASQFSDNVRVNLIEEYYETSFQRNYNLLVFYSDEWKFLHGLVGDKWMEHLMSECSIFEVLPNDCYLQISGAPLTNIVAFTHQVTVGGGGTEQEGFTKLKEITQERNGALETGGSARHTDVCDDIFGKNTNKRKNTSDHVSKFKKSKTLCAEKVGEGDEEVVGKAAGAHSRHSKNVKLSLVPMNIERVNDNNNEIVKNINNINLTTTDNSNCNKIFNNTNINNNNNNLKNGNNSLRNNNIGFESTNGKDTRNVSSADQQNSKGGCNKSNNANIKNNKNNINKANRKKKKNNCSTNKKRKKSVVALSRPGNISSAQCLKPFESSLVIYKTCILYYNSLLWRRRPPLRIMAVEEGDGRKGGVREVGVKSGSGKDGDDARRVYDGRLENSINQALSSVKLFSHSQPTETFEVAVCGASVKARLEELWRQLEHNHRLCRYPVLLRHYVTLKQPSPLLLSLLHETEQGVTESSDVSRDVESLLQLHTPCLHVYLFVRAVLRRVVPVQLFGGMHNRRVFIARVREFILSDRYDYLTLGRLMSGVKSRCGWLRPLKKTSLKLRLLARLHLWLLQGVVAPVLRSFFYVTEKMAYKNKLFMYPSLVWKRLVKLTLEQRVKEGKLVAVEKKDVQFSLRTRSTLGVSPFRLLPKTSSVRLILNMRRLREVDGRRKCINWDLQDLACVLTLHSPRSSSVVSNSDLHDRWKRWVRFYRNPSSKIFKRPIFFVKLDLQDCYDRISQTTMKNVIKDLLPSEAQYYLFRYSRVTMGAHEPLVTKKRAAKKREKDENYLNMKAYLEAEVLREKKNGVVFVFNTHAYLMSCAELLDRTKKHLMNNLLVHRGRYFRQMAGISQGSCVSTLLCHIYLSHMEECMVKIHNEDLMLRMVDDYLFITTDLPRAQSFLRTFIRMDTRYKMVVNLQKTLINFDHEGIKRSDYFIQWCGFLINPCNLEVHSDFSKYCTNFFRHSISTASRCNPGFQIFYKLQLSLKSKTAAIFFDEGINSRRTILHNLYKLYLISAFRFFRLVSKLPISNSASKNPVFFLNIIYKLIFFIASRYRVKRDTELRQCYKGVAEHLCLIAFDIKLSKHQAQFNPLLQRIRSRLRLTLHVYLNHLQALELDYFPTDFQLICD